MAEYVKYQKGKRKLCSSPFMFVKASDGADNKETWKCEIRTCKARVHTKNDIVTYACGVHNHAPVHGKVVVAKARAEVKQRTEDTEEKTTKKRKTYQRIDDAIKTMVSRYGSEDGITYLTNRARILNINVT